MSSPPPTLHPPLQPINKEELGAIAGPAAMHAIGHVAANLSFAAVAISLTHTVKTLEPAFNVILSQLILGGWLGGREAQGFWTCYCCEGGQRGWCSDTACKQ